MTLALQEGFASTECQVMNSNITRTPYLLELRAPLLINGERQNLMVASPNIQDSVISHLNTEDFSSSRSFPFRTRICQATAIYPQAI